MSVTYVSTAIVEFTNGANTCPFATCGMQSRAGGGPQFSLTKIVNVVPSHLIQAIVEQNLEIDAILDTMHVLGIVEDNDAGREFVEQMLKLLHPTEDIEIFMDWSDPFFWKHRLVYHFSIAPDLHSVRFIPTSATAEGVVFIEKLGDGLGIQPVVDARELQINDRKLLTAEEQARLAAQSMLTQRYPIHQDQDIPPTIQGLEDRVSSDLKVCLRCFLRDTTNKIVRITFKADNKHISRAWERV
jgi:hypothetical protein